MKAIFLLVVASLSQCLQAQTPVYYKSELGNPLCSSNLFFYPSGEFLYEYGCEASSHLSFGNWIKKKDTFKLQPVNPKTYAVIKEVQKTSIAGDSIWLIVLDRHGVNITAAVSAGLEVAGRGSYMFSNDSAGASKFVYKRSGGKILLRTLNKLFGQRLELPTDSANHFIVTLNLPADWIKSTHADWGLSTPMALLKKGDDLMVISPSSSTQFFKKQTDK